ncbi:MAG: type II secretion system major pseudopilin GspG [Proteobacteria bacterium]|nr:type II secretion system major pseudopilin GspG [Pseudomonadota bacterium]
MKDKIFEKRLDNKGFTLIELMVVMVILGILASRIVPMILGRVDEAKFTDAKMDIQALETALKLYKLDNGDYPTTEQGLLALVESPETEGGSSKWKKGGYIERGRVPKDPWGYEYIYLSPGMHGPFDIMSYGADGEQGGDDNNRDVNNWEIE